MKNPIILFSLFILLALSSCGGGNKAAEEAAVKEEVQKLDSISTEIEQVAIEIDAKTKALDEAISEMEKELEQ